MVKRKKRQKKDNLRYIKPALILAGGSAGASVIHSAMPAGTGGALSSASSGMASMVGPAATIGGAAMVMNQLKKFPKPKRKKIKRRRY